MFDRVKELLKAGKSVYQGGVIVLPLEQPELPAPVQPFDVPDPDAPATRDEKGRVLCAVCKKSPARLPYGWCADCTGQWEEFEVSKRQE